MIRLTQTKIHPIGVDVGRDSMKLLQLEVTDGQLAARAALRHEFPEESRSDVWKRLGDAANIVQRSLPGSAFRGRKATLCVPRDLVHVKNFRLPVMPEDELEAAVRFEARHLFPFDPQEAAVRCIPAGEVRQGSDTLQEVIVMAVKNDVLDSLTEKFHRAGLEIASIDVEPCALFRAVERFVRRREDESEVHVLADIGYAGTQIIIGRGKTISFMKVIDVGGEHFNDSVVRRLGIKDSDARNLRRRFAEEPAEGSDEKRDPVRQAVADAVRADVERLAREVALCLRYQSVTFRGWRPSRVRLFGGEGADAMVRSIFASQLSIPVETGRPLWSVASSQLPARERGTAASAWAVALGLALRHTTGSFGSRDGRRRETRSITPENPPEPSHAAQSPQPAPLATPPARAPRPAHPPSPRADRLEPAEPAEALQREESAAAASPRELQTSQEGVHA